jgi:hypothetical protein
MSINNNVFAQSRFWQGCSGKNRLNFHRPRPRNRERLPSDGFIERDASTLPILLNNERVASDKALT